MSGHSKWANIKYRKATQDAKRGKLFQKLVRAIIVAAREGGGDPSMNIRLKTAIERAREANVPMDNIERAIKRGTGESEGVQYEEVFYEGYGPCGVAILVEALTDNRNKTASEMRTLFSRNGGSLGEAGCVSWMFERRGVIRITGEGLDEDELLSVALEAGADDVKNEDGEFVVYCDPATFSKVKGALGGHGFAVSGAEVGMVPKSTVSISDKDDAHKVVRLLNLLEDHDDVQNVYANFDIPDEILEEVSSV
ncbi:MAG TPA: YebC/PmpR family DNA-binding transcriptional regulator [Thermosynergistes sp.]|nr:YebC/PmpR family DNA-binding transcriptional regulator [Thermosynergistes sp.]HPU76668.1 YebC/PmpR family DNA-binding transcriptional regulator [Thermosynergistes sp.]HQE20330.1 YebC/PmpR family DNA-binding transcriptional regulator [Thermosynergistes sp.]HXK88848.1 YebC/PmpR family DNA-binding transcriptional regulator [Thermosynergistes sp.]